MSRTYRKPKHHIEESPTRYIDRELNRYKNDKFGYRRFKRKRVKYTEEERNQLFERRKDDPAYCWKDKATGQINVYVPKYKTVRTPLTEEQFLKNTIENRSKYTRDGHWLKGHSKKDYRTLSNKHLRTRNRHHRMKVLKDEDNYETLEHTRHDAKKYIWSVW